VANAVRFTGLTIDEILPMASTEPAKYMGIDPAGRVTANWDPVGCRLTILKVYNRL
jgi:N-acetylglucosamine-6-phosphate deacetylase